MASSPAADRAGAPAPLGRRYAADLADQPAMLARVQGVNAAPLVTARTLLAGARSVRLLGVGSSRHAAGIGAAALELAGIAADVPPAPGAAVPPPVMHPGDLLIAVSQSGQTPSLVDAVRQARQAGCAVITVTNGTGPLVSLADVVLDCAAGAEHVIAATKSVTTSVVLLRALVGELDVAPLVSAVHRLLTADAAPLTTGPHPEHVVAGGLGAEWVAAEVALKFAETGGRLLTAEPLVEHLHGPVAVGSPTLAFLDPADPNTDAVGAGVVRVGTDPSYDVVLPPLADRTATAILWLVAGQVAALARARQAGVDADDARGLSKVTRSA